MSYDLKTRLDEVGLANLANELLPSEETLISLEKKGKNAREKGRPYVGSSDGEDLMSNFRPVWSRTPKVDVFVGEGSFEDKVKSVLEAKRARSAEDRMGFTGFSNFLGHVTDWGTKMIITKVFSNFELLSYIMNLTRISEDLGGVRVAYQYDIVLRQRMAQALERGDVSDVKQFLVSVNKNILSDAKEKLNKRVQEVSRATTKGGGKSGKSVPKGGKTASDNRAPSTPPKRAGGSWESQSGTTKWAKTNKGGKGGKSHK